MCVALFSFVVRPMRVFARSFSEYHLYSCLIARSLLSIIDAVVGDDLIHGETANVLIIG